GGEAEIAKLLVQIAQQAPRRRDRLQRIERIIEATVARGFFRELRDAERPGRADDVRPETAFLIQEAEVEVRWQMIAARRYGKSVTASLARTIDDRLHKRVKRLERQHDGFVTRRLVSADVGIHIGVALCCLFARRRAANQRLGVTRCKRQPTPDQRDDDAGTNITSEREALSSGQSAEQPAKH